MTTTTIKSEAKYDVVIMGAGAIGSALALALSQQGYRIALLDACKPHFASSDPERVIALSEGSRRYLESLGVWQAIAAHDVGLIQHIAVREPYHAGAVDMSHNALGSEALGYVVEVRHVVQALHEALADTAVDMLIPMLCERVCQHEQGVSLTVQDHTGAYPIHASLLAGADGSDSFVRRQAGITTRGWEHNRMGIVTSITTEKGHACTAYECFREQGPLALLPLADGRFSLVWSVAPKAAVELMQCDEVSFLRVLSNEVGDEVLDKVGAFTGLNQRASFPLELRIAQCFAKNNILLVGNAAHTIHPVAGQGMNLGLRDVAVLADILRQSWAKEDLSKPLVGQTYAERRRLDTLGVVGFTEGVLAAFAEPAFSFSPKRLLRGMGLHALERVSPLKQLLLEQAAGVRQMEKINGAG